MILNTIREGSIVPSGVTVKLIQREMESSDNHKFLIDGFPRSEENRVAFEHIVSLTFDLILHKFELKEVMFSLFRPLLSVPLPVSLCI